MSTISIIGGGIAGLTTAIGLKQFGKNVAVYESATELKTVGAGIILASNAMQVYKEYGLEKTIENLGNRISEVNITDSNLKILSHTNLLPFEEKFGVSNIAVHRALLQQVLIDALDTSDLHINKRVVGISNTDTFEVLFQDNSKLKTNYLIGADGIHSQVRNLLFEKIDVRNANQLCWRGIATMELPFSYRNQMVEAWGRGKRFGFVNIGQGKVYWYALTNDKQMGTSFNTNDFKEFHTLIHQIIEQTPEEQIFYNPIIDLKPIQKWQANNVCLIGDAVHATTPNLGQGACQAIEDAYVLCELMNYFSNPNEAFAKYESIRKSKAHYVVDMSWKFGKIAQIENPIGIQLRNFILKMTPQSVNAKQLNKLYTLNTL